MGVSECVLEATVSRWTCTWSTACVYHTLTLGLCVWLRLVPFGVPVWSWQPSLTHLYDIKQLIKNKPITKVRTWTHSASDSNLRRSIYCGFWFGPDSIRPTCSTPTLLPGQLTSKTSPKQLSVKWSTWKQSRVLCPKDTMSTHWSHLSPGLDSFRPGLRPRCITPDSMKLSLKFCY